MKKFSLYILVDIFFKFILLFTINIIWSLYFIRTIWLSLLCAFFVTVLIIVISSIIDRKKEKRKSGKLEETQHIEDIKNTFIYMKHSDQIDFFYNLASTKHQAIKNQNHIEVLTDQKTIIVPHFKTENLTQDSIIEIYNNIEKDKVKKIIILCTNYDIKINECISNFKIKTIVLDYKQTYTHLLNVYEFYPEITIRPKKKVKNSFRQLCSTAFSKKKTKGYLTSALFIIFASFFVIYKVYYLIVATILIIFAILCQFEFKFNKIEKEELIN